MKDINYLRKLAGLPTILTENVADLPATNDLINNAVNALPAEQQSRYLDALDVLKLAGRSGLAGGEWVTKYREFQPDDQDAKATVMAVASMFNKLVIEKIDMRWRWIIEGAAGINQGLRGAMEDHVSVSSVVMATARRMGIVTLGGLARTVSVQLKMSLDAAHMSVLTVVGNNPKMFQELPDGSYQFNDPVERNGGKSDYSQMFKDMAKNANKSQLGDD